MAQLIADPKIKVAYTDVRNDHTETNWLLLSYEPTKDVLHVAATGNGSFNELKEHLKENEAGFAYVRVNISNDELSKRAKFCLVSWCGSGVRVMRRARLSTHIAEVKKVLSVFSVEVAASSLEDLMEEEVLLKLKRAMGANYDRQASSY